MYDIKALNVVTVHRQRPSLPPAEYSALQVMGSIGGVNSCKIKSPDFRL